MVGRRPDVVIHSSVGRSDGNFLHYKIKEMSIVLLKDEPRNNCHDCGVEPGEHHVIGCDMERCPKCGGQLISCDCQLDEDWFEKYEREVWSGIGYEEAKLLCEKNGWYVRFNQLIGWQKCDITSPDATHDINRAMIYLQQHWKPKFKK